MQEHAQRTVCLCLDVCLNQAAQWINGAHPLPVSMWKRLLFVVAHPADVSGAPVWQAAAAATPSAWRAALLHVLPKLTAPPPGATAALVVLLFAAVFAKRRKKLASRAKDPRIAPSGRGERPSSPRVVLEQQSPQGWSEQAQSDMASRSSWDWSSEDNALEQCLPVHPLARRADAGHGCLRQPQPSVAGPPLATGHSPQAVADSIAIFATVLLAVGVTLLMRRRRRREPSELDDRAGRPVPTAQGVAARDPKRALSQVAPPPSVAREQRSNSWTSAFTLMQAAVAALVWTTRPTGLDDDNSPDASRERHGASSAGWRAPAAWRPSANDNPTAQPPAGAPTKRPVPSPTSTGKPTPAASRLPRPSTSPSSSLAASSHAQPATPSRLPPPPTSSRASPRATKRSPPTPEAEAALAALEARLEAAYKACDTDASGNISKRELYRALDRLGLKATTSEQLAFWNAIDRDHNNVIDWSEFRRAGLALHNLGELRLNEPAPNAQTAGGRAAKHSPETSGAGAFARRTYSDEGRVDEASRSLAVLARRGSEELIRGTMRALLRGNRPQHAGAR